MKEPLYIFEGDTKPFAVQLEDSEQVQFAIQNGATVTAYLRRKELVVDEITGEESTQTVANGPLVSCSSSTPGAVWASGIVAIFYAADVALKEGIFDLVVVVAQGGTTDSFIGNNKVTVYKRVVFA